MKMSILSRWGHLHFTPGLWNTSVFLFARVDVFVIYEFMVLKSFK